MERYGKNFSMSSKAREPWSYNQNIYHGEGHDPLTSGFSWPPRSYTCSFCKREFRSAQALGGHMNVHRRDRARLRQSPPWNSTNTNPSPPAALRTNTNKVPNLNSPPPPSSHVTDATKISSLSTYSLPSPLSRRPSRSSSASSADLFCVDAREVKNLLQKNDMLQNNRSEMLRLDLEIGVCGYLKEDLDLELRLGCS